MEPHRLDPTEATEQELAGEQIFMGKGQCGVCHIPQFAFMDNNMHDLKLERFYEIGRTVNGLVTLPDGAGKPLPCAASRIRHPICMTVAS